MLLSGVALAAFVAAANALNLSVAASGGNATSPLQYGLMFEVSQPSMLSFSDYRLISKGHQLFR